MYISDTGSYMSNQITPRNYTYGELNFSLINNRDHYREDQRPLNARTPALPAIFLINTCWVNIRLYHSNTTRSISRKSVELDPYQKARSTRLKSSLFLTWNCICDVSLKPDIEVGLAPTSQTLINNNNSVFICHTFYNLLFVINYTLKTETDIYLLHTTTCNIT